MPDMPAAPAASAPAAAPSVPAPAAAPAAAPAPAPSAAPASQPASQPAIEPAGQPGGGQPPAAADPAAPAGAPKAAPKSEDYPHNEEGLVKFLNDYDKWATENPDAAAAAELERDGQQPEAQPAEQKQDEKPADKPAEEKKADPAAAAEPLPQAFQQALEKDPALKAALEANPAAQKLVMDAARASEAAKPILALVPTAEAAQFMAGHANTMLDLRHNFLMGIDNPEAAKAGWEGLLSQFIETDDKGQPVKDAAGKPVYGKDLRSGVLNPATNMVLGGLRDQVLNQIKDLEQKTKGYYPSEAAKNADVAALDDAGYTRDAINYVLSLLSGESADELPPLPEDATPAQKATQERLQRQQEELKRQQQEAGQGKQAATVQAYENKMRLGWQSGVGKAIDTAIKEAQDRGEYIPDYILHRPWIDPQTKQQSNVAALAVEILNEYDATVQGIPTERNEMQRLQRLGLAGEQQRAANDARLRTTYLPTIIRKHIDAIQDGIRESQKAEAARQGKVAEVARTEPQTASGGGAAAATLTDAQVEEKAQASAKRDPQWATGDRETRFAILARERTRAKFGY